VAIAEFQREHGPKPLALAIETAFAAPLGGRLHVVARDSSWRLCHVAIDARGDAGPVVDVPLASATGLVACGEALVVSGWTAADQPAVVWLTPDGAAVSAADVPAERPLYLWPRPVRLGGTAWLLWTAGTAGGPRMVYLAEATGGTPRPIAFDDATEEIDAVGDGDGLWVARVKGNGGLALARVSSGGAVVGERLVESSRATAPSLASLGAEGVALAWIYEPGEARLQLFDTQLVAAAPPDLLAPPAASGPIEGVRLFAAADGALAVTLRSRAIVGDGGTTRLADGTRAHRDPQRVTHLRVAAYDRPARRLGPAHPLEPDQQVHAAAWVGRALVVVHRGPTTGTQVTVFGRAHHPHG
jgi:hypothetical protein